MQTIVEFITGHARARTSLTDSTGANQ